ncbi:doublesex- and mab-3-related transcription factor B1 [Mus pahari]|uniref:doublesex- and mab-3-related transcription factor B1 n=1 Tax=Mus pahari TaxID=10093 RepID=UPI000A31100E|nr:doublesex- and mab-3-related transcription factor B1 [Mus pahari]
MLRTPKCSRCRNHGYLVPVKGHAGKCRWKQCICDKCYLITERQKIMAAQKVLKTQDAEEQVATVGTQGPQQPPRAPAAAAAGATATATASSSSLCPLPRAAPGDAGPGPAATCFLQRPPQAPSPGPSTFQLGPSGRPGPSTFQPRPGAPGGLRDRRPAWLPQLRPQAPRPELCYPDKHRPVRPVPRLPFADYGHPLKFKSDHVVGAGYPERESCKQCPACVPVPPYQLFPLAEGQDSSSALGVPQQRGFRHVSCSPYHGRGLMSEPARDLQPTYCSPPPPLPLPPPPPLPAPPPMPQQPHFLPPGYLSALHFLPPPPPPPSPPSFSLTVLYDTDKENTNDQDAAAPSEPSQHSPQAQSN